MDKYLVRLPKKPTEEATPQVKEPLQPLETDNENNKENQSHKCFDIESDEEDVPVIPIKKVKTGEPTAASLVKTKSKVTPGASKSKKKKGKTVEQHRRQMGDAIKSRLSMEKYCMKADCHATVQVPIDIFRELVVPNALSVTPENFNESTPVVVALIKGSTAAGEVFGKSKIKGGNRYEQCEVQKAEFVFFPSEGKARIWWIMYSRYYENDSNEE